MSNWMWDGHIKGERFRMFRRHESGELVVEHERYGKHGGYNYNYYFEQVYDQGIIKEVMAAAAADRLEDRVPGWQSVNDVRKQFYNLPALEDSK